VNFAAFADCNVGELLSDQGRLDAAEPMLRRALRVWRGTADEHGVAFATAVLGRLHARAGQDEPAVELLDHALARFRALGAQTDAAHVEVLQAEAAVFAGRAEDARERLAEISAGLPQDALLEPLLHQVTGVTLAQLGDATAAERALETSLAAARDAELPFETLLALDALCQLGAPEQLRRERHALLTRLDIVRLPRPPLVAAAQVG
jgi:tetratricopeptide (TPR) repeat protein